MPKKFLTVSDVAKLMGVTPLTVRNWDTKGKLVAYLEKNGIETRSMFAGNILKHPAYEDVEAKDGGVNEANYILEHSFWISVHPRLTKDDLKYMCKVFDNFFSND